MMIIGYISGGISLLIIMCVVFYSIGYNAGYEQATIAVRKSVKTWKRYP